MRRTRTIQSAGFALLRIVLGVGIALFLIGATMRKAELSPSDLWQRLQAANRPLLLLGFLLHGAIIGIAAFRWRMLLHAQKVPIRWRQTFRLSLIGFFFNLAVPGAVGGDVVKVGYLAKNGGGKTTEAIFSILVDRLFGIFGLFLVAAACVLLALPALLGLPAESAFIRNAAFLVGLGSVAGIAGLVALEFNEKLINLPGLRRLWPHIGRYAPGKLVATATRLVAAVDLYRRNKPSLALAVVLSLAIHTLLAVNLYAVARAVGEREMRVREYFLTTQVSNAVASIPVTPGGLGLRDRSNQEFLIAFGMDDAMAALIPLSMSLIIVAWAFVGLIVFIVSPAIGDIPQPDALPPTLPIEPCE